MHNKLIKIAVNNFNMIKSNQFYSNNRQDDLLKRLKQCVGSIENKPKNIKSYPSQRLSEKLNNKQFVDDQLINQRNYEGRASYRQSLSNKQNQTDKKYHLKNQEYRQSSDMKSSWKDDNNSDILMLTKNYLEGSQNNYRTYRSDLKQLLPFNDSLNITNVKRDLFARQQQEGKTYSGVKEVTQTTRKRIAQRESLINGQSIKIDHQHAYEKPKIDAFNEDQFLQRLSLKKNNYLDQTYSRKRNSSQSNNEGSLQNKIQKNILSDYSKEIHDEFKIESKIKQSINNSEKIKFEKFKYYSEVAMKNLVKENDFRKAEKIQKLKKITKMNDQINNRIKKIVNNFESYLTHRQI